MKTKLSILKQRSMFFGLLLMFISIKDSAFAQSETWMTLSLKQVIAMAQEKSPSAMAALHTYKAAYWNYRNYRAGYLPALNFSSSPYLNRTTDYLTKDDGTEAYVKYNNLKTDLSLNLTQNVWFTGGTFSLQSSVRRLDLLGTQSTSYNAQPLQLSYRQDLFGYNSQKWDRRIEPLKYREARKSYAETMELVASRASSYFFSLAAAQTNLDIAHSNYAHADTLYHFAMGRYHIGTITENELLQLELNKLSAEADVLSSEITLDDAINNLRTFLNIQEEVKLRVTVDDSIPQFDIPLGQAMNLAQANSPEMEYFQEKRLQGQSNLAYAKANAGLKASIYMQLGLSQTSDNFKESFQNPLDEQYVSVSLSLPILDWGKGRGKVKMAQSNLDLVNTQVDQSMIDFEQNVINLVKQFNLQAKRVDIAHRTAKTAMHRYDVARQLYILGKSTILDLNAATTEKDSAMRSYIGSLSSYWSLYYTLRSITQYDFEHHHLLELAYDLDK